MAFRGRDRGLSEGAPSETKQAPSMTSAALPHAGATPPPPPLNVGVSSAGGSSVPGRPPAPPPTTGESIESRFTSADFLALQALQVCAVCASGEVGLMVGLMFALSLRFSDAMLMIVRDTHADLIILSFVVLCFITGANL